MYFHLLRRHFVQPIEPISAVQIDKNASIIYQPDLTLLLYKS